MSFPVGAVIIVGAISYVVVNGMGKLRRLANAPTDRRPAGPNDIGADVRTPYDSAAHELGLQGCKLLGDSVESNGGRVSGVTRWFADKDGTTCGWFGVARPANGPPRPVMLAFSESSTGRYIVTSRGGSMKGLARPPHILRTGVQWEAGLAGLLRRHAESVRKSGATPVQLRKFETMGEAHEMMERMRSSSQRWRESQPALPLFIKDFAGILGG